MSLVPGPYKVCCLLCSPSLRSSASALQLPFSGSAALPRAELLGSRCWRARRSLRPSSPLQYVSPFRYFVSCVHSCHVTIWDYLPGDEGGGRHFKNPEVPTYLGKAGSVDGKPTREEGALRNVPPRKVWLFLLQGWGVAVRPEQTRRDRASSADICVGMALTSGGHVHFCAGSLFIGGPWRGSPLNFLKRRWWQKLLPDRGRLFWAQSKCRHFVFSTRFLMTGFNWVPLQPLSTGLQGALPHSVISYEIILTLFKSR